MNNRNILLFCFVLCCFFSACEKENFDNSTSIIEVHNPIVSLLPYGAWDVNIDTFNVELDTSGIGKFGSVGRMEGFDIQTNIECKIEFYVGPDGDYLEEGVYDLQKVEVNFFPNTLVWEGNQVEGTVEITLVEEVFDPIYNFNRLETSGFLNGILTDPDGTEHDFVSTFNKIKQ